MANKHQVIALHKAHPTWTSVQIAEELDCESAYVRATFQRNGLFLPNSDVRKEETRKIMELGHECRKAGITLADIQKFSRTRNLNHSTSKE